MAPRPPTGAPGKRPMTTDQEVRDRFAKYVEQERRAEAAGFLPPSGTGSNVYTRGAADVDHDEEAELRRLESGAETSSASTPIPPAPMQPLRCRKPRRSNSSRHPPLRRRERRSSPMMT